MQPTIPDKLIERCCRKEHKAQMELYSLLFGMVYGSALRILKNAHDAEEVTQEAFLKLFQNMERYRDMLPFIVRRIAINASIDRLRKQRVSFVEFGPKHDVGYEIKEMHVDETRNEVKAVKDAILQLPSGYRVIITLRLIEEMSFGEIAEQLGINEGTARSQFFRAKQRVVEMVGNYRKDS